MSKWDRELLDSVKGNLPAIRILWEIQNIKRTFKVPEESNGPKMDTNEEGINNVLYDTIKNILDSVGCIVGVLEKDAPEEEYDEVYDLLEAMEIQLIILNSTTRTFRLASCTETEYVEFKV